MESQSRSASVCAGCPFPRLGRARLGADRVPCLVVRFLARAVRAASPPAGRGGDCATLGRPSMALAAEHLRGGCRYRFDDSDPRQAATLVVRTASFMVATIGA